MPLLDRFTVVLPFDFDLDDFVAWGLQQDLPPVLFAFARFKPQILEKFEPSKDMTKTSTPRSFVGMGRLINLGLEDYETLRGAVGEGAATEFLAFYRTWKELPSRDEIYLNPTGVPVPEKPDVLFALMGSLAYGANPTNMEAMVKYLNRCPKEFSVLCMKDAMLRDPKIKASKAFLTWALANRQAFGHDV
jgi:hypothetical protein